MSLMNATTSATDIKIKASQEANSSKNELTICVETVNEEKSQVSGALKPRVKTNEGSLRMLFEETLKEAGDIPLSKVEWKRDNEVVVGGLAPMTLHSFVSKAEQLGKKISYERTLKVKITD